MKNNKDYSKHNDKNKSTMDVDNKSAGKQAGNKDMQNNNSQSQSGYQKKDGGQGKSYQSDVSRSGSDKNLKK